MIHEVRIYAPDGTLKRVVSPETLKKLLYMNDCKLQNCFLCGRDFWVSNKAIKVKNCPTCRPIAKAASQQKYVDKMKKSEPEEVKP